MRPDSEVYLSGDINNKPSEQFPVSVVYQSFPVGLYRISPKLQSLGSLGTGFDVWDKNIREPKLTVGDQSEDQLWYFKHMGDNEYSIFTHNQKEILKISDYGNPQLQPYDEEEGKEQDVRYRWVFPKATGVSGNKDEVTVSIQLAAFPRYICWKEDG